MFKALIGRRDDENGATAVECGLIAALIALASLTAMATLGGNLDTLFNTVAADLTVVEPAPAPAGGLALEWDRARSLCKDERRKRLGSAQQWLAALAKDPCP